MFARHAAVTHISDGPVIRLSHGLLLFAPLALIGNFAGALLRYPDIGAAVLFPPYAALTAALLLTPRRDWVWYILVGAAAHFAAHWPRWGLSWVFFADVANVARALTATLLFLGLFRGRPQFDGIVPLLRFMVCAVVVAPAVGATIGATNVVMHDSRSSFGIVWNAWFLSNALTGLTMLPALYLAAQVKRHWNPDTDGSRVLELAAAAALLVASCSAMLLISHGARWQMALILYAPMPALIWMALRFGVSGASVPATGRWLRLNAG